MMEITAQQSAQKPNVDWLPASYAAPVRRIQASEADAYPPSIRFIGGIYNRLDKPHQASLLKRNWGGLVNVQAPEHGFAPRRANARVIAKRAIYGGLLMDHFGHFLLETLARAWYINNHPGYVFFFKTEASQPNSVNKLCSWQQELLGGLVDDTSRIKLIHEQLLFNNLAVPRPGFVIRQFCRNNQVKALREVGTRILQQNPSHFVSHDKVWLSRSALGYGMVYGEAEFEQALQREGFWVFHPERHSVAEQIHVLETSAVVAGFTGSAFHTLLLARNNGARLLHFSRVKDINESYAICANASGFAAEFYNFFVKYDNGTTNTELPTLANVYQDLPGIWQVLRKQGLVSRPSYVQPGGALIRWLRRNCCLGQPYSRNNAAR